MDSFKALLIEERDGKVVSGFSMLDETRLDPGSVTIRVAYSSVNYKDALAATGAGKIIRRFPCVGGIDLSGTVIARELYQPLSHKVLNSLGIRRITSEAILL